MIRRLINIAILALVVHAVWRVVPPFWQYMQFKEAVAETARFAGSRSENEIHQRVMTLAERHAVPIAADAVQVKRDADQVLIEGSYTVPLRVLPWYSYPWEFKVHAEAWSLTGRSLPQ